MVRFHISLKTPMLFHKDFDNNIFRIYFTEFEGSSTGKISFNITQMNSSVSTNDKITQL